MDKLNSPRLIKVEEFLRQRGSLGATTLELVQHCGIASARDYIRRLRDHGRVIDTVEAGQSETGARIVRYKLLTTQQRLIDFMDGSNA